MNFTEITFEVILLGLAAFFLLIQIFYFVFFFFRLAFHKEQKIDSQSLPPISIIVAARSEAHNLVEFLPYLFEQNYPEFEVVVVNDRSWDDTKEILKAFQLKYSNLHVVNIEETNHKSNGKKMAVTLGIKGAKYEHLALTDADCKPVSQNWLMSIGMKFQNSDTKIVLGYSPFKKEKGFLNSLIRFDGFWVALQYLSFAKAGKPYMGVGRNLAYTKNDFFKIGGFKKHYNLKSGDDDLFVNEIANNRNTAVVLNEDSHVPFYNSASLQIQPSILAFTVAIKPRFILYFSSTIIGFEQVFIDYFGFISGSNPISYTYLYPRRKMVRSKRYCVVGFFL